MTSKSEIDSGSDYRRSRYVRENYDQLILGLFFSSINGQPTYATDDSKMKKKKKMMIIMVRGELFTWSNEESSYDDSYSKVWLEERAIEDASAACHK